MLAQTGSAEVIHLSCHGYFDEEDPLGSGLLLADGTSRPPAAIGTIEYLRRPDFLLTARELQKAKLKASLVTLSACSTGLQASRNRGDEFEGLPRSLLLAGASSVLATLWNVDQLSSARFFKNFYRSWSPGGGTPRWQALRDAQLGMLNSDQPHLQHPYHWAPYVLAGDWR